MAGCGIFILTALVSCVECMFRLLEEHPEIYDEHPTWSFNLCGCDWPKICHVYFPVHEKVKSCDVNSGPKAVSHHLWSPWTTEMGFNVIVCLCAHNASSAVPMSRQATHCYQEQDRLNWPMQIVVYGAMLQCLPTFAGHIRLCLFLTSSSLCPPLH